MNNASRSTAAILFTRLVLVAIAAGGVVVGLVARRVGNAPAAAAATRPSFVCPMHPEVTSPSPGDCPICRMALEPMANVATAEPAALKLATVARELRAFDAVSRVKRFATSQEMRFSAWAESPDTGVALVYRDQAKLLVAGETGQFSSLSGPAASLAVRIGRIGKEPPEPWDASTVRVRFHAAPGVALPAGGTGVVKFDTRLRRDLVIREGAVLRSPDGPYVLVATDDRHTLSKRRVELGSIVYGYAAVVSGLKEDEWVVAKHTFALDTARRLGWRSE